jgi:hypothetical protein
LDTRRGTLFRISICWQDRNGEQVHKTFSVSTEKNSSERAPVVQNLRSARGAQVEIFIHLSREREGLFDDPPKFQECNWSVHGLRSPLTRVVLTLTHAKNTAKEKVSEPQMTTNFICDVVIHNMTSYSLAGNKPRVELELNVTCEEENISTNPGNAPFNDRPSIILGAIMEAAIYLANQPVAKMTVAHYQQLDKYQELLKKQQIDKEYMSELINTLKDTSATGKSEELALIKKYLDDVPKLKKDIEERGNEIAKTQEEHDTFVSSAKACRKDLEDCKRKVNCLFASLFAFLDRLEVKEESIVPQYPSIFHTDDFEDSIERDAELEEYTKDDVLTSKEYLTKQEKAAS